MWAFIVRGLLCAIIIHSCVVIRDVSPVPSASTSPQWRGSYTQSSYWYSDYAAPKPPQPPTKKSFLPTPQHCPDTGRTVCADVKPFYPSDDVFDVIRAAKAKRFNISSEFVDESLNDEEPHFYDQQPPPPPPQPYNNPKHEGYVVYQTAVHYDNNHHNTYKPNNYDNRQLNYNNQYSPYGSSDHSQQNYGYNNDNSYNPHKDQYRPTYGKHKPYASHQSPPSDRYPNDYHNNYYPPSHQQSSNGYQQPYENEMISQRHQSRYKRQTPGAGAEVVDPVCPSRMILVEPKAALNDRSQWKFVINLADRDPRLKQAIKVEVCQTPGQSCSNQISLPFGFVSRCKQKYIKKKLLSLDSSGQSISSENFFAPSCCVCEVVRNSNKRK